MSHRTLIATCDCRTTHFTLTLPTNTLPLTVHLCHCTVCRRTHGAPCSFHAPVPLGNEPVFIAPSSLDTSLTGYVHGPSAKSTRYFCTTCGCHIGDRDCKGQWYISVSIFQEGDSAAWEIASHAYTHSTGDGGISGLLNVIDGRKLEVWNPPQDTQGGQQEATSNALLGQHVQRQEQADGEDEDKGEGEEDQTLLAQCHCGGIAARISRPGSSKSDPTKKWRAFFGLSRDARLVTGTHVTGWLSVGKERISPPIPTGTLCIGTAKSYRSSKNVLRAFCGVCGATAFFVSHQASQAGIVNVATGILRAEEGVMLGSWASWEWISGITSLQDGLRYDEGFACALSEGLRAWRIKHHGDTKGPAPDDELDT
ncbi:Mss4-like protein [Aspergillus pseudoustus]|uniref:Mss4-like protein n=1 Tax=Aspergillus pseudoustus TaxID=1810923 RepID=A0ABR4KXQ5_9EURO